ncbi:hypothetical protein CROQUDRAFT_369258 [Cronartium quercuum f. sp. fusiforme G11]|uniref:Tc1-like transposase DDE domain-containing protein n=1 Tax=Cronartium quercuum f. sp. fusiforme G11 TaxID=708437 RepID=A0A9P6TEL6_9BASI|nr:hypothetical protein CROQUDRAFT_369258 [Cronartium quercuum f. sp. fusiforme G11]
MYLVEIQKKMLDITGKKVSVETIRSDLRTRLGLSLVQTRRVDPRQSAEDRAAYIAYIAGVPVEYLVFIDESGVTAKDTYRDKSWTPKGTQTKREVRIRDSEHLTLLPAVTEAGMIAGTVYKGAVERVHVEMFLKRHLVSPFINLPSASLPKADKTWSLYSFR